MRKFKKALALVLALIMLMSLTATFVSAKGDKELVSVAYGVSMADCEIWLSEVNVDYDGTEKKPAVIVMYDSVTLREGVDYTVSYRDNINSGTGKADVTGIGRFSGTVTKEFFILTRFDISGFSVNLSETTYTYDGNPKTPSVTVMPMGIALVLEEGTDYTVTYENNVEPGTATAIITGCGGYKGTVTRTFTIEGGEGFTKDISSCTITLDKYSYTYDGNPKSPAVTVKDGNKTLMEFMDYLLVYTNNTEVGTATVMVTGMGQYSGTAFVDYTIEPKSFQGTSITLCDISLDKTMFTYDGNPKTPAVTVIYGAKTLVMGVDYSLAYNNNVNVGTASVTVTGLGNYKDSKTVEFIIKNKSGEFTWGVDNWNFLNAAPTYYPRTTYRQQISESYLQELKKHLTNTEYAVVFGSEFYQGYLDETWSGSCYGMSTLALLAKEGMVSASDYQSGATKLYDLAAPINSAEVSSLITYYHMLQFKDVIQQEYRTAVSRSHEMNIKKILSVLDENTTCLICFSDSDWGGHAVLAYDYSFGSWTYGGVTYDGCISVCDPNHSMYYGSDANIYFNSSTYNWTIPLYDYVPISSAEGSVFMYVGADINDLNQGGFLYAGANSTSENYVARIDAASISENRSVSKVTSTNGAYVANAAGPGEIVEDYSYFLGSERKGTAGYNLMDAESAYKVTQKTPVELDLSISYEDSLLRGKSAAGSSVVFDKDGIVEVNGEAADFEISMTFNEDYPTSWFTVEVEGHGANEATLEMIEGGYILSADNLKDVEVNANNKDVSATVSFSTDYASVYIYEINEVTIGVKVDADGNGTYETQIETEGQEDLLNGDVNSDGKLNIRDATAIQKYLAKMADFNDAQLRVADFDKNGKVNVKDATAIQKKLAGII